MILSQIDLELSSYCKKFLFFFLSIVLASAKNKGAEG